MAVKNYRGFKERRPSTSFRDAVSQIEKMKPTTPPVTAPMSDEIKTDDPNTNERTEPDAARIPEDIVIPAVDTPPEGVEKTDWQKNVEEIKRKKAEAEVNQEGI